MRYSDLIRKNFEVHSQSGAEFNVRCIWHDDQGKPNLYINAVNGLYICFSCGAKGTLSKDYEAPPQDTQDVRNKLKRIMKPPKKLRILPESYLNVFRTEGVYAAWAERGLNPEIVDKFLLGFDPMDNGSLIIPVVDRYRNVYGFVRRYTDGRIPKYDYPYGINMSDYVFGLNHLGKRHSKIAIVEGSIDAMSCWQARVPALAIWGSTMQPNQELQIRRANIRHIVLMMDNDGPGRTAAETLQKTITWAKVTTAVYRPYWTVSDQGVARSVKDPGELVDSRIRKMFHSSR